MILLWALTALLTQQPAASPTVVLDFEFFRAQVQPIFLEKRPGYTRCVVCHRRRGAHSVFTGALAGCDDVG